MVKVTIQNKVGLHARPATVFATEAKKYDSEITVNKLGIAYNAKSPMRLMSAGIEFGDEVEIIAFGPDAQAAEKALADLIKHLE